ncbi:diguanylate cyclase [Noviherbaspirillum saxi]|uniref:diguanylate cyclase n=1 Tax=Noviherbaspirillum saxi TaxID=2320863 RepID=A0A3A3FMM2_9BURK|nr:diguanylate cyclase [Noviherbaspirillum saxi]RJF97143.1 diguanylate cyclase [Noviherbaspirillum saxi]
MSRENASPNNNVPADDVTIGFWERHEKFSPDTEHAYQLEMDRMRQQRITKTGLAGAVLYGAFAISDRSMVPDVYQQAWAIRFLLVIPLMLLGTFIVHRLKSLAARDLAIAISILVCGASVPVIAGLSSHPNAVHYQTGITLIILFGNIVVSQRFRSALWTSAVLVVLYGITLSNVPLMPPHVRFSNWLFCLSAVVISLIANFRMDQDQRRAYLARTRDHARNRELSQAVELLGKLSAEDALTQIANRREFDRRLNIEWARARRGNCELALVLIDVDCFKNYNDHYGHPSGDACLKKIADVLRSVPKRSADLVARFGGEEFVALLPSTSRDDARILAEKMRQGVADLQIPHATSRVAPGVTASFGVATLRPDESLQPADLVAAADAALYKAKEGGRNQVAEAAAISTLPQ